MILQAIRGIAVMLGLFAAAFALHIVGGATDQAWLFAIAVTLIFVIATGFPAFALWAGGLAYQANEVAKSTFSFGVIIGTGLTLGALWATNDREFAGWHFPVSLILVAIVSAIVLFIRVVVETGKMPEKRRRGSTS